MRTPLQRLIEDFSSLHAEGIRISGSDHLPDDLAALLKVAGGSLEGFLKSHIFGISGKGPNLYDLIERLTSLGIHSSHIGSLHALRMKCNSSKHDPSYEASIDDVAHVLHGAIAALQAFVGKSLGSSEVQVDTKYRRRLWLAAWDHFVHGDCEVSIFAPVSENDFWAPPGIDIIYLKGLAWPDVLRPLGKCIREPEGLIPKKFLDFWTNEGDFAGARVFDGSYRDLIRSLSAEEKRLDLIPFLKRESDGLAMRSAISFASIDVVGTVISPVTKEEFEDQILQTASSQYGAPVTSPFVRKFANRISTLMLKVDRRLWPSMSGPRFVTLSKFEQLRSRSLAMDEDMLIASNYELIVRA